jgi:hypothetical protein
VFLNDMGDSRKGEKMRKMTQEVGSQNADRGKCGQSKNLGARRLGVRLIAEEG